MDTSDTMSDDVTVFAHSLLGLTFYEADERAKASGYTLRLKTICDILVGHLSGSDDAKFNSKRINVEMTKGLIVGAYIG